MRSILKTTLAILALVLAGFLAYAETLDNYFLADDYALIASFWGKGPQYLAKLAVSDEVGGIWQERFIRPMRLWSLALDHALWGLDPKGYHLSDVFFHVLASALVFALALHFGKRRLPALAAALFFLLHPLNVETAAWNTGRDETLSTVALLASFLLYLRSGGGMKARPSLVASWMLFAVSLFTKEYAVLFPIAILALPAAGLAGRREAALGSLPYWAVVALFLAIRLWAFGSVVGGYGTGAGHTVLSPALFWSALSGFARVLVQPILERPLLLLLALACGVALALGRRGAPSSRLVAYWAFWFLLFLLPTHNLIFTPRHLYLSFAGLSVGIALALSRSPWPQRAWLEGALVAMVVALLLPPTVRRTEEFARASSMCESALRDMGSIARTLERGDVVVLVGFPAHDQPPWGFGWSLKDALGPPFLAEKLESKVTLVTRREWREEAWARYRAEYSDRPIQVLVWNPAKLRLDGPGGFPLETPSVVSTTDAPRLR